VGIDGDWSARDFATLLTRFDQAYLTAAALAWLADQSYTQVRSTLQLESLPFDVPPTEPPVQVATAAEAIQIANSLTLGNGLSIGGIILQSPGFLEFVGWLNPLQQIRQFITDWRRINADKAKLAMEHERKKTEDEHRHEEKMLQIEIQRRKTQWGIAFDLLKRMSRGKQAGVAADLIEQFKQSLIPVASDMRVIEAKLLPEGEAA
jgi:hypothetical protein